MRAYYPLARNVTLFDDGKPMMNLNRENFLIIEHDGSLNALYRDSEDETRLYLTVMPDETRFFMIANRTPAGVPMEALMVLKDMLTPGQSSMMMGMQIDENSVVGAMLVTMPGSYWDKGKLPDWQRN